MNIDNIIDEALTPEPVADQGPEEEAPQDLEDVPLHDLLVMDLDDVNIKYEIYSRFKSDVENYIENYLLTCPDPKAPEGMYKCSLETWQACISNIGIFYFARNKYLYDKKKIAAAGGVALHDGLLSIALELYELLCYQFKKQFFIYDCCRFLGISKDLMWKLSDLHADLLKKAHNAQESSMRSALASGRSNVTAMAILLNHDYDYTRTTQVIHTSAADKLTADRLPELVQDQQPKSIPQHVVVDVPESDFENM